MLHKQVCQYFIAPALLLSIAFGISPVTASPEATDLRVCVMATDSGTSTTCHLPGWI
jgi:hypothetical protein